ncbi:MAG: ATP-binding protein [Bacillota bacterium]|nr:ATP-binding protein [Bacillota bacterium]
MVIGKTLFDFLPEKHAKQKQDFYEMAWNGTPVNYEGTLAGITYLASLSPTILNSRVVEVNGTAIDITMEKKNEIKIREMEKLSVIGELAAGIAHEIRNPLTSLIGFTQIIKESINNVVLEEYLKIMMDELNRINTIVNEFMFIAKPNETMVIKETNINTLISAVIKFMEPQSNLKSIKITSTSDSIITAFCDPNQLKQVLINLLQNAIEATTDPNNNIDISLEYFNDDHYIIKISDRGAGISEERQSRLFEPFYTTKEKGTGLGLMVCKRIIDIHGGTIDVDSKQGEGTVFRIQLPKACSKEKEA